MKMFVALTVVAVGILNSASAFAAPEELVGSWLVREENGQPQSNYYKNYYSDGRFTVEEICPVEEKNMGAGSGSSKVICYESKVRQRGSWEKIDDNTIVEKCEMGDKGNVKISYTLADGILHQSFAYNAAPEKKYSQKLCYVERLDSPKVRDRQSTKEYKVKHFGTFGSADGVVFIMDGKHYDDIDKLNADIPDDKSQIENISAIKSRNAFNYMTDEEIAAGNTGVIVITLLKK